MSETSKIDNFHYVKKMAKGFEDDEKRFLFIRSQILSFEECMEDGLQKSQLIKSLISWVLKEFAKVEGYKSDPRMLVLWKLLGKYSVNIGMDGVLENVHRLGFFKSCPDFYLMWADYLGSNDNKENFDKVIQVCEKNCQISSAECQELFRPLIEKYFDIDYNVGKTLDLMKIFDDGKEVVKPDLTLFQNKRGALSTSEMELVNVINTTKVILKNKEQTINNEKKVKNFKLMDVHLSPKKGVQSEVPTEEYSVYKDVTSSKTTTATTCDVKNNEKNRRISFFPGLNDITIAGSHGKFSSDMFTSTPCRSVMPNDFDHSPEFPSPLQKKKKGYQ
ncbi:hypothetical protein Mgra_00005521 [Meloidogyne graminicola]|uniref:BUB1 N-terminal domain-containing protein n=1 Tax=Meloidogyne graminicola TaxID=189291 RepID=A0A8S9ZNS8_9BILA|nr:hypothetical protein Mgra_00005521 [Meloidogyne graminicola]